MVLYKLSSHLFNEELSTEILTESPIPSSLQVFAATSVMVSYLAAMTRLQE